MSQFRYAWDWEDQYVYSLMSKIHTVLKLKSWIFLSCSLSIYIFLKIIMKISFNVIGAILKNFPFQIYRENVKELPVESPQRVCIVEVLEKCQRYHFFPVFVFHLFIY